MFLEVGSGLFGVGSKVGSRQRRGLKEPQARVIHMASSRHSLRCEYMSSHKTGGGQTWRNCI